MGKLSRRIPGAFTVVVLGLLVGCTTPNAPVEEPPAESPTKETPSDETPEPLMASGWSVEIRDAQPLAGNPVWTWVASATDQGVSVMADAKGDAPGMFDESAKAEWKLTEAQAKALGKLVTTHDWAKLAAQWQDDQPNMGGKNSVITLTHGEKTVVIKQMSFRNDPDLSNLRTLMTTRPAVD